MEGRKLHPLRGVHRGLPFGALELDKNEWNLTFNKEKCLICELCVKACPLKVMNVSDNGAEINV